jgi:cysteine desulfurase
MSSVYLDHAAATALDPRVLAAMLPYFADHFGNPQSFYALGARTKEAIEQSRQQVAQLVNARPEEIIFTSSGTESNNLALKGIALANQDKGKHIIVSSIEHVSVLNVARTLSRHGFEVTFLPVDRTGRVDPARLKSGIRSDTILISVLTANNEVGTVQPIAEIGRIARAARVPFHTDAVAAAGTIPLDAAALGVDALTLTAQNFYGPKGAAALALRQGIRLQGQIEGGGQEHNRRAGTENVPAIVGLGKAAELARAEMTERAVHLQRLRDRLIAELPRRIERVYLTGHPTQRLPGHASFCVEFIEGEAMLLFLDDEGIAAASGSACTSRALKASHVLLAMGYDHALAQGSLMLTLGPGNRDEDVTALLDKLPPIVARLRSMSPLYAKYLKDPQGHDRRQMEEKVCTARK